MIILVGYAASGALSSAPPQAVDRGPDEAGVHSLVGVVAPPNDAVGTASVPGLHSWGRCPGAERIALLLATDEPLPHWPPAVGVP